MVAVPPKSWFHEKQAERFWRTLPVGAPGQAESVASSATFSLGRWSAPVTEPGTYDVFVSVGECDGTPVVELPLPKSDGHRRYLLGRIRFE